DVLDFLGVPEGDDTRKRDVTAKGEGPFGQVATRCETMENKGEGPLPFGLFLEDRGHVFVGGAAVDNQWKTGDPGGRDVPTEARGLRLARRVVVKVVEPGFADSNAARMRT